MPLRTIEYMAVDELVPAEKNPKDHAIDEIKASIEEFGVIDIGVVDDRTGRIISGHGRTEVYELLSQGEQAGVEPPDGVEVREGRWFVPIVRGWSSKSDDHAKAALVALNRLTEKGGWIDQDLVDILSDVSSIDGLLETTGFSRDELADLLASVAGPPDLDDLAESLGEPDDAAFWPVLRFKVPPEVRSRYLALMASVEGGDAEQFAWLVEQAEGVRRAEQVKAPA